MVYGQTPYGLSQTLKISPGEAKEFIDTYFKRYSKVQGFLRSLVEEAREKGFVTTMLGRRRYFPDIKSQNRMVREMAERAAINAPIQGSAADMIKVAMVRLAARLKKEKLKSKLILQVHDELVLEAIDGEVKAVEKAVKEEMEGAFELKTPIRVDMGTGRSWGET